MPCTAASTCKIYCKEMPINFSYSYNCRKTLFELPAVFSRLTCCACKSCCTPFLGWCLCCGWLLTCARKGDLEEPKILKSYLNPHFLLKFNHLLPPSLLLKYQLLWDCQYLCSMQTKIYKGLTKLKDRKLTCLRFRVASTNSGFMPTARHLAYRHRLQLVRVMLLTCIIGPMQFHT